MPSLRRWIQFLSSAGITVGLGVMFVQYGTPSDDTFLRTLSPELQERYEKEREIRVRANEILQKKMEETKDKPAWLQGTGAMLKLDQQVNEEARSLIERERENTALASERERLRQLAEREKSLK